MFSCLLTRLFFFDKYEIITLLIIIDKLPKQSTKHTLMLGAGYGLVSGGLQDLSSYLKGTPVWYLPQSLKERSLALKLPEPEE